VIAAFGPLLMRLVFKNSKPSNSKQNLPTAGSPHLPRLYWIFWIALVLAVSIEFCMVFWSADYLENGLGMNKANAAQAVSLFLAAMIIGRLAGSRLVLHFSGPKVVVASILVAAAGFLLYWKTGSVLPGLAGLFITGLGVANLYPIILSMAIGASNGNTVMAGARATLASGTAIFSLPLVLGRLADAVKIQQAYGVVALLLVSVLVMIGLTTYLAQPKKAIIQ
jgi:fucose permease